MFICVRARNWFTETVYKCNPINFLHTKIKWRRMTRTKASTFRVKQHISKCAVSFVLLKGLSEWFFFRSIIFRLSLYCWWENRMDMCWCSLPVRVAYQAVEYKVEMRLVYIVDHLRVVVANWESMLMGMRAHQRNHSYSHRCQTDQLKMLLLLHKHRFSRVFSTWDGRGDQTNRSVLWGEETEKTKKKKRQTRRQIQIHRRVRWRDLHIYFHVLHK